MVREWPLTTVEPLYNDIPYKSNLFSDNGTYNPANIFFGVYRTCL